MVTRLRKEISVPASMPSFLLNVANSMHNIVCTISVKTLRPIILLQNVHTDASNRNSISMAAINNVVHFHLGI